jgi:hypothetical protein
VPVTETTFDADLFGEFRYQYFNQKSWIRRFAELREVNDIKFVMVLFLDYPMLLTKLTLNRQFNLTQTRVNAQAEVVDVIKTDVWPPARLRDKWRYLPCPARNIPLVGSNYLLHIWRHPHHADQIVYEEWARRASLWRRLQEWFRHWPVRKIQQFRGVPLSDGSSFMLRSNIVGDQEQLGPPRSRYVFTKIPKKVGERLKYDLGDLSVQDGSADDDISGEGDGKDNEYSGWGLCFEESFKAHRLVFALWLLYNMVSLPILTWYVVMFGLPKLQSWAEISGLVTWFAGDLTSFVTWWFKWADT